MAHADEFLSLNGGRQKGRPFIGMQVDQNIVVLLMQAAADMPQGADRIVLPLFIDSDEMIDIGVVADDVGNFFVDDEGDIRPLGVAAQDLQKGRDENEIAKMHEKGDNYFFLA